MGRGYSWICRRAHRRAACHQCLPPGFFAHHRGWNIIRGEFDFRTLDVVYGVLGSAYILFFNF